MVDIVTDVSVFDFPAEFLLYLKYFTRAVYLAEELGDVNMPVEPAVRVKTNRKSKLVKLLKLVIIFYSLFVII